MDDNGLVLPLSHAKKLQPATVSSGSPEKSSLTSSKWAAWSSNSCLLSRINYHHPLSDTSQDGKGNESSTMQMQMEARIVALKEQLLQSEAVVLRLFFFVSGEYVLGAHSVDIDICALKERL